jgi:hypothetical protein
MPSGSSYIASGHCKHSFVPPMHACQATRTSHTKPLCQHRSHFLLLQAPTHPDNSAGTARLSRLKDFLLAESLARSATHVSTTGIRQVSPKSAALDDRHAHLDPDQIANRRDSLQMLISASKEFMPSQFSPRSRSRPRNVPVLKLTPRPPTANSTAGQPISQASARARQQSSARAKTVGVPVTHGFTWENDVLEIEMRQLQTAKATFGITPRDASNSFRAKTRTMSAHTPRGADTARMQSSTGTNTSMSGGYRHPYGAEFGSNTSRSRRSIACSVSGLMHVVSPSLSPALTPRSFVSAAQMVAKFRYACVYDVRVCMCWCACVNVCVLVRVSRWSLNPDMFLCVSFVFVHLYVSLCVCLCVYVCVCVRVFFVCFCVCPLPSWSLYAGMFVCI